MAFLMPFAFDIQKNERIFAPLKASVFVWKALNYLAYNESIKYHIEPRTVIETCSATGKECSAKNQKYK
jgi:hypothetical protein